MPSGMIPTLMGLGGGREMMDARRVEALSGGRGTSGGYVHLCSEDGLVV
jgi:hypothetical protein